MASAKKKSGRKAKAGLRCDNPPQHGTRVIFKRREIVDLSKPLKKIELNLSGRRSFRLAAIPDDWTLQVDCDSRKALRETLKRLNFFRARVRAYAKLQGWKFTSKVSRSSTRGHYHVTIRSSERLTISERICAQALLGSDVNREIYNFFRALNGSRFPILFYEKSEAK